MSRNRLPPQLGGTRMHADSAFTEEQMRELDLRGLHLGRMTPDQFMRVTIVVELGELRHALTPAAPGGLGWTYRDIEVPVVDRRRSHVTVVMPSGQLVAFAVRA